MPELQLHFPAKPYWITQGWGIKNPSYEQFGFSAHNGVDFSVGTDKHVYCPLRSEVVEQGYNSGAGNFLRCVSTDKWEVGDKTCYVGWMVMHFEKTYPKVGDILEVGTDLGIADNTGFSTGPHTHTSWYRLKSPKNTPTNRLDTDKATNYTFDPQPYYNGKFAQDIQKPIQPANTSVPYEEAVKLLNRGGLTGSLLSSAQAILKKVFGRN